jgi:hypothetical protein
MVQEWDLFSIDPTVTDAILQRWISLAGIPSCWRFRVVEPDGRWTAKDRGSFGIWPVPTKSNAIVVFSASDSRFSPRAGGVTWHDGGPCTIGHWSDRDTDIGMGARIWHEILHACGVDSDQMDKVDKKAFCAHLRSAGSPRAGWCRGIDLGEPGHTHLLLDYYRWLTGLRLSPPCGGPGIPGGRRTPPSPSRGLWESIVRAVMGSNSREDARK